jgi:hypothetical protein
MINHSPDLKGKYPLNTIASVYIVMFKNTNNSFEINLDKWKERKEFYQDILLRGLAEESEPKRENKLVEKFIFVFYLFSIMYLGME